MSDIVIIKREGSIAQLVLNRPKVYNALDLEVVGVLADRLTSLAADGAIRAIILTGEGKAFCSGGDLKWAVAFPGGPLSAFHTLAGRLHQAVLEIRRMEKPVLAAVNGVAAGAGFSLALACDFRVMDKSAYFRQAYTSNGLCIDGGGTFTLPRIVGLARSMEIAAFDRPISSAQSLDWGLVTKVSDDGRALPEAAAMAGELIRGSLSSFAWSKRLLTDSFTTPFESHIEREREGLCACAVHPDGQEGLRAFVEKRKPVFFRG